MRGEHIGSPLKLLWGFFSLLSLFFSSRFGATLRGAQSLLLVLPQGSLLTGI